jgi:predicted  nucleic acid-binding Zn-ribbon protein
MVTWLDRLLLRRYGPWTPPERTPMPKHPHEFSTIGKTHLVTRHITGFSPGHDSLQVRTTGGTYEFADPEGEHYRAMVDEFTAMANGPDLDDLTTTIKPWAISPASPKPWKETPEELDDTVHDRNVRYADVLAQSDTWLIRATNSQEEDRKSAMRAWMKLTPEQRNIQREIMFRNFWMTAQRAVELLGQNKTLRSTVDDMTTRMKWFEDKVDEADKTVVALTAQIRGLEEANAVAGKEVKSAFDAAREDAHQRANLRQKLEESDKAVVALTRQLADAQAMAHTHADEIKRQAGKLADRADEIAQLKEDMADLHDSVIQSRNDLARTRDEADSRETHLAAELAQARNDLASKTDQVTDLKGQLMEQKVEVDKLDEAVRERDSRIQETAAQLLAAKAQLGRVRQIAGEAI